MQTPAVAQTAPSAGWFIEDWAEQVWLQILDRQGGAGGRFGANGLLFRFDDRVDEEYRLDLLATRFSHADNVDWHAGTGGFRWRAGSVTKRDMATFGEGRVAVPVGDRWRFGVRMNLEQHIQADRAFVRPWFEWSFAEHYLAYAAGSLESRKPGSDLEVGARWKGAGPRAPTAHVAVAVLDWVNNLIYVSLNAAGGGEVESTVVYDRQPLAVRGAFDVPISGTARLRAYGGYVPPSVARTYAGVMSDSGFRQWERMGFAAAVLAWDLTPAVQLSAVGTLVEARSERTRLSPTVPIDEFALLERTTEVGGLTSAHLGRSVYLDGVALHVRRVERRDNGTTPSRSVNYEDHAWVGELLLLRRPRRGLTADLGALFDLRDVVRGEGQPPGWSARARPHQWRVRADIGWRFGDQAGFSVGTAFDVDGDGMARRFDGIRGRFLMVW